MGNERGPVVGRRILIALLVPAVVVHARLAVGTTWPLLAVLEVAVAIAAVAALALVVRRADGRALLAAAVAGGLGVALFLVPGLVRLVQGQDAAGWLDPWAFGALLVDAMVVRIAFFTLRKLDEPSVT
ncbi:hypothetical protein H7X46_27125 [Pseudonocardia sp. C8]|uniref:hypothetical protein n=1 Tax=Pseudonocardia sp. C8 TaxID=2762759 RepID=UPI0016432EB0|nr:hypothetical protein [Pseudonocardia sp. C8]MBC3194728.1 hypothetical protein [Pseudonocardia sp. C8]